MDHLFLMPLLSETPVNCLNVVNVHLQLPRPSEFCVAAGGPGLRHRAASHFRYYKATVLISDNNRKYFLHLGGGTGIGQELKREQGQQKW